MMLRRRACFTSKGRVGAGTTPGLPGGGPFVCGRREETGELGRRLRRDL
jgi:hypothetical protein